MPVSLAEIEKRKEAKKPFSLADIDFKARGVAESSTLDVSQQPSTISGIIPGLPERPATLQAQKPSFADVLRAGLAGGAKGVTAGYAGGDTEEYESRAPTAFKIGEVVGAVAPIGAISKGAGLLKPLAKVPSFVRSAVVGGAYGGVKKLSPEQERLQEVATDAIAFGGIDAALGVVGKYVAKPVIARIRSKLVDKAPDKQAEIIAQEVGKAKPQLQGDLAASPEAISRVGAEKATGVRYFRFDSNKGTLDPIAITVDTVDLPAKDSVIIKIKDGKIIDWKSENIRRTDELEKYVLGKVPKIPEGGMLGGYGKFSKESFVYEKGFWKSRKTGELVPDWLSDKLSKDWFKLKKLSQRAEELKIRRELGDKSAEYELESLATPLEPVSPDVAVKQFTEALAGFKPFRAVQEKLLTAERGRRMARAQAVGEKEVGEKGFYSELSQFKGGMPKVVFEGLREKLNQGTIDALFSAIKDSPHITEWEAVSARKGLARLFGGFGGGVPTEGELKLLEKVFPTEMVDVIKGTPAGFFKKLKEAGLQLANMPRTIMSSLGDFSFGLRQGVFAAPRYRKQFFASFRKQFSWFASDKAYQATMEEITRRPTFKLMRGRVAFTDMGQKMQFREERYMSNWAEKIPLIGIGVRATERAYVGFANKMRADMFDRLFTDAERLGLNPAENPEMLKGIAEFVNTATGRGSLGAVEPAARILNAVFFSPKLMASRLKLLNPLYYINADPFVRKEAVKSLLTFAGTAGTILTAAKLAGLEVGADPRSADFGKIKIGKTRIDIGGGFQQYLRVAGQLISGEYVSSTTGRRKELGEGYKPTTRLDILQRQVESKEAPVFSLITTLLRGQDFQGKPVSVPEEVAKRFVPMIAADIYEIAQEDPELIPLSALGVFGVGLQTYTRKR